MIIFLYGQDNFRSRLKLNELKNKYLREIDKLGSGLKIINGAKASFSEITAAISPSSLLSKKRLIIIEDVFINKDKLIFENLSEYFKNKKQDDNIIIVWESNIKTKKFKNVLAPMLLDSSGKEKPLLKKQTEFFKFLSSQKYSYNFNLLSNTESADWVKRQTALRGGKIRAKAAEMLVSLVGPDGWQINNELDKLLSYKAAGALTQAEVHIEIEDVQNLVRGNFSENIFALTDALSVKNKSLAIKLLDEQIEAGLSDGYLLNMFVRQFRILLQIKQALESGLNQRQIAGKLKLHPFVAQKGLEQTRHFTLPILKNILSQLVKIDYQVKSGQSDYLTGLNMLIASL
ncbi:DNA polymerase III subunit delta [Patescibacteria group bacterium]|nr:DNA polymerase III subunit delta [Patescibacteria group bacterium]MBU1663389.1 DNA polymerase III subunit delta [Patescibacteria group bacterium]MBU1933746.1 DNA polymerase III subunit delta [Patescibacteria group bacterium]